MDISCGWLKPTWPVPLFKVKSSPYNPSRSPPRQRVLMRRVSARPVGHLSKCFCTARSEVGLCSEVLPSFPNSVPTSPVNQSHPSEGARRSCEGRLFTCGQQVRKGFLIYSAAGLNTSSCTTRPLSKCEEESTGRPLAPQVPGPGRTPLVAVPAPRREANAYSQTDDMQRALRTFSQGHEREDEEEQC